LRIFIAFHIQEKKLITNMESPAFFFTIFLGCLLLSITGYSIYVGFGPPSKQLRDPFEEHED
jgi:PsbN protein